MIKGPPTIAFPGAVRPYGGFTLQKTTAQAGPPFLSAYIESSQTSSWNPAWALPNIPLPLTLKRRGIQNMYPTAFLSVNYFYYMLASALTVISNRPATEPGAR